MGFHISKINGLISANATRQSIVAQIANDLRFKELGIYYLPETADDDNELSHRIDGIIASLSADDTIVLQYPTSNGKRFEEMLMNKMQAYRNLRVIIMVNQMQPNQLEESVRFLNRASAIILPSKEMHHSLVEYGLIVNRVVIRTIEDYPTDSLVTDHVNTKEIHSIDCSKKPSHLITALSWGGFGKVWSDDTMNQPLELGICISAGIPVVVKEHMCIAKFVKENGIGIVASDWGDAQRQVQETDDEKYRKYCQNVRDLQPVCAGGCFTKQDLLRALTISRQKQSAVDFEVKDIDDSLDYILKHHCSVARFGDGEMDLIRGRSITYQDYSVQLGDDLKHILQQKSNENCLICVSDVFNNRERYNSNCRHFWELNLQKDLNFYREICTAPWYGSTFISRPYIDLEDKSKSAGYFAKLKQIWEGRDILIVEGATSRSGCGNDLFANAKSIARIIGPSRNAYDMKDRIMEAITQYGKEKLILLMLGPAAKVLAYQLSQKGYWAIDLGHIDSEYEWFKMGAYEKVKLSNKHTAEHNTDENIEFVSDPEYENQILVKL